MFDSSDGSLPRWKGFFVGVFFPRHGSGHRRTFLWAPKGRGPLFGFFFCGAAGCFSLPLVMPWYRFRRWGFVKSSVLSLSLSLVSRSLFFVNAATRTNAPSLFGVTDGL